MNADKDTPRFTHATFGLDRSNRNTFTDKEAKVTIIPLWAEGENLRALITTPEKGADALRAALAIQKLKGSSTRPGGKGENQRIEECIAHFKRLDFKTSYELAREALKN